MPELDDPGFDHSVLCEFRPRLAQGDAADRLLQVMLRRLVEAGLLKSGGRQRTDATHVLAAVRTLSRLALVGESLRAALEQLARPAPNWLFPLVEPEWDKRYGRKVEIGTVPGGKAGITALAEAFGRAGRRSWPPCGRRTPPPRLRRLAQVEILREDRQHRYAIRAGIEATLSQNVRTCGLRGTRYRGLPKTHVQPVLTALACNVTRIAEWIAAPTRPRRAPSHFHALSTAAS